MVIHKIYELFPCLIYLPILTFSLKYYLPLLLLTSYSALLFSYSTIPISQNADSSLTFKKGNVLGQFIPNFLIYFSHFRKRTRCQIHQPQKNFPLPVLHLDPQKSLRPTTFWYSQFHPFPYQKADPSPPSSFPIFSYPHKICILQDPIP